jgi:PAS domain S-box-containing protein
MYGQMVHGSGAVASSQYYETRPEISSASQNSARHDFAQVGGTEDPEQAALLDVATDAIVVQDLNNHILYWNQGAERLYGWKTDEAKGLNALELLYKKSFIEPTRCFVSVAKEGSWQGELHQITKSGKQIIVSSRWTLVRDQAEQPKSILTVNTDITAKKT